MAPEAAPRSWILAIDTGTSDIVVVLGRPDGTVLEQAQEAAGFRHGEVLLATVEGLLLQAGQRREDVGGIVVGTGPGAFTGLRVGLATAKTMAHAFRVPMVGVSTALALVRAAGLPSSPASERPDVVLLMPAGPRDRIVVFPGEPPRMLLDPTELAEVDPAVLVAVDLEGRAPADAVARGVRARRGLGRAILEIGTERLRSGATDDVERMVPDYVTLPRGIRATSGSIEWSRDPR